MLKLFVCGVGSAMIAQAIAARFYPQKFERSRHFTNNSFGMLRVICGTFLVGTGMALAGTGPTMVPAQLGVGVSSIGYIIGGALVGGTIHSLLEGALNLRTTFKADANADTSIDHHLHAKYSNVAAPLGALFIGCERLFSVFFPTAGEQAALSNALTTPPIVAGLVLGLNQIPLRLIGGVSQGGTRSIMALLNVMTFGKIGARFKLSAPEVKFQFAYVWGGILLGSFAASMVMKLPRPEGFSALESFLGGVIMIIGARTANGCTCGHGISGFSELSFESIAGAASIFAGGIATTFLMGALQA